MHVRPVLPVFSEKKKDKWLCQQVFMLNHWIYRCRCKEKKGFVNLMQFNNVSTNMTCRSLLFHWKLTKHYKVHCLLQMTPLSTTKQHDDKHISHLPIENELWPTWEINCWYPTKRHNGLTLVFVCGAQAIEHYAEMGFLLRFWDLSREPSFGAAVWEARSKNQQGRCWTATGPEISFISLTKWWWICRIIYG